jgi:fumarate reductase subunit D
MILLQVFGDSFGVGNLVIAIVVPVLVVAFGTYVGVLVALQSFFEASSWQEATQLDED